ncbi:MAG: Inner membrane protein YedI [Betaproteobacteria bacterium ADurb.Bin341]|nr:MAG: Inner membrane protein YedI [Betaproteobacteria bacterium ADurb.Bin341]
MAGASLLALIDDIASILDDVSVMTKVAAKKTAGVLGDDLALNAQQVAGVQAERELPVVWAVAIGSLKNKLILVPSALAISALLPWAIMPLLMLGGLYLCLEGVEKLAHKWLHSATEEDAEHARTIAALADASVDLVALEKEKIKGAIRTDFVLSAEIIVIALGTVSGKPFGVQVAVLSGIGLIMTAGVYGIVAGIVKMDDLGLYLLGKPAAIARAVGRGLLLAAPRLMKMLTVVGTAAMFMVGGGILTHGIPGAPDLIHHTAATAAQVPALGTILKMLTPTLLDVATGILAGTFALLAVSACGALAKLLRKRA